MKTRKWTRMQMLGNDKKAKKAVEDKKADKDADPGCEEAEKAVEAGPVADPEHGKEAEAVDEDKKEHLVAVPQDKDDPAAAPQGEAPLNDDNYDKNNPLGVDWEFDDNEPMYKDTEAGLVAAPRKDDPLDEERGEDDSQVRQVKEEAKSWVLGIDDVVSCVPAELQPVVTLLRKEAQHLKTKIAPLLN